jgi:hypothetical protein
MHPGLPPLHGGRPGDQFFQHLYNFFIDIFKHMISPNDNKNYVVFG